MPRLAKKQLSVVPSGQISSAQLPAAPVTAEQLTSTACPYCAAHPHVAPRVVPAEFETHDREESVADVDACGPFLCRQFSIRNFDCKNYETCLGIAAALNWDSFSCFGCCERVNQRALWNGMAAVRESSTLKQVCGLPNPKET